LKTDGVLWVCIDESLMGFKDRHSLILLGQSGNARRFKKRGASIRGFGFELKEVIQTKALEE
jgi:hypothetical protein